MPHEQKEIDKFNDLAHEWWNSDGEFQTLHHINPIRLQYVLDHVDLRGKKVLDVGCGGGLFTELLSQNGAQVTGLDLAPQSIKVAQLHLYESQLNIDYKCISIAELATQSPAEFDIITCMEMLEHVPQPDNIIASCAQLLKNGGHAFFSTLNRNLKSYTLGVIAAEYILKLLPRGTHDYKKFIKPSELRHMLNTHNLNLLDIKGVHYNPWLHSAHITHDTSINYMLYCQKNYD